LQIDIEVAGCCFIEGSNSFVDGGQVQDILG
jgi:hypothetical protein